MLFDRVVMWLWFCNINLCGGNRRKVHSFL